MIKNKGNFAGFSIFISEVVWVLCDKRKFCYDCGLCISRNYQSSIEKSLYSPYSFVWINPISDGLSFGIKFNVDIIRCWNGSPRAKHFWQPCRFSWFSRESMFSTVIEPSDFSCSSVVFTHHAERCMMAISIAAKNEQKTL